MSEAQVHGAYQNHLPMIEEDEAEGEIANIYAEVMQEMQIPSVPNLLKGLAASPGALAFHWEFTRNADRYIRLPQALVAMILFTIADRNDCQYCSASHELTCRTLGVDEETLSGLANDLEHVSPKRTKVIIKFALKAAHNPKGLRSEDFDRVREFGITDGEIAEIILVAVAANYADTLADALKIRVEPMVAQALEH